MAVAVEGDAKQVERILRRAQITEAVRDAAWDAFFAAASPTDFKTRFEGLTLPTEVKAALWDVKYGAQVTTRAAHPGPVKPAASIVPPAPEIAAARKIRYAGAQPSLVPQVHELPPLPGLRQPLLNLEQFVPPAGEEEPATGYGRFIAGAERGIAGAASRLTTGENIGLIGTMKAAPKVLGAAIGGTLSGAAGLYFTYEMARALVESLPEAAKAWKARDYGRLGEILGGDAVTALLLGPAARHTRETVRGALPPVPMPERVTELPPSEAGRARLRAEAGPGAAGPATSREQRRAATLPPSTGRHDLRSELRDLHVARLRGTAKRLGMDYEKMSPGERETLEHIQHEMNLAAWENLATPGPSWWPAEAESRRMAAVGPSVAQERPPSRR